MANNATSENSVGGKKLTELKVVELRSELEKRGLDKTGVKAVLLERLEKALEGEGKVSADYLFTENELKSKKSTGRLSKGAVEKEIKDNEEEDEDEEDEDASQSIPTTANKSVEPNDSANMSSNLEVEKSEKSLDVAPSVDDVKNEEQNMISHEEPISSEEKSKTPSNDTVKTDDVSTDSPAPPPPSSSSLADVNTKEEDEQNDADESAVASTQEENQSALGSSNEVKEDAVATAAADNDKEKKEGDEVQNPVCDLLPPTPTSVPCVAPLTLDDTINMDTSTAQQSEENESLIVHVDDTQNDLDADLLTSQINGLKSKQAAKEKAIGKTEGKKSDAGSSPLKSGSETGGGGSAGVGGVSCNKGNPDDVKKTEKKADEKKDEKKDGKLKSCPSDSKLKIVKNLKETSTGPRGNSTVKIDDNQNTGNLWIRGLSSNIKAADVKELFSKYGKVVVVKVVTNARAPGAQRYVFLTMSSSEEAAKCIQHLNQTELHGKKMSVERAKNNLAPQTVKKVETKLGEKKSVMKKNAAGQNSRNLWVSGLSSNTRAADLKALFSKYGKVVDAKVVTNVRSPGARCYGFLTMFSSEEVSKCIQRLNQTELHGKMISVERAKNDPGLQSAKKIETKPGEKKTEKPEVKKDKKDEKDRKPVGKRDDKRYSSTGSHRKPLDKSRVVVMGCKGKGAPVIGVKRGGKEGGITDNKSKMAAGKEKLSTTPKAKSKETTTEGSKDKNKESKKDVLSFDRIKISRPSNVKKQLYEHFKAESEKERVRQSQRRLREKTRRLLELDRARAIQRDVQRRQIDEAIRLEQITEKLRMQRERLEREKLERERLKLEREYFEHERIRTEQRRAEILRFEEQKRRTLKRSYERSNVQHEEGFWSEPKRPAISTSSSNRFEHGFANESRFNEFKPRDPERRVERYERRDTRSVDNIAAARFEERKDRDLARRDIGAVREIRERDDRRPDERSHSNDRFDRREVGPSRDRSNDWNHETDRRELGLDRGRDSDRRNVSAHDRLGRVKNSPAVSQPPPPPHTSSHRSLWGSGPDRKVDTWSHPHSNLNNGRVNYPNDKWINSNVATNHARRPNSSSSYVGGSGAGPGSSGMVQNMGHRNVYVNPQTQSSSMAVGGSNMGSRMQEPRFDAYMQRY